MRECTVAAERGQRLAGTIADLVVANATEDPTHLLFTEGLRPGAGVARRDVTATRFLAEVTAVAKGFVAAGIEPGQRVGLMSRTRYEWTLCDFALWFAGAVPVPIYETSAPEQVRWILGQSEAVACVVESAANEATVREVFGDLPDLRQVWQLDAGAVDALTSAGAGVTDEDLEGRRSSRRGDDLATIIFTSGTTGRPRGCPLTHRNLLAEVDSVGAVAPELFHPGASTVLFLPLAHVLARVVEVTCLSAGTRVAHTPDVASLVDDLSAFHPTVVLAVPRVFEKLFNTARQQAQATHRGRVFDLAASVAVSYSTALERGRRPNPALRAAHAVFDRLVYRKLRAALGGQVRHVVSGGAPLGERLGHFFRAIGVTVLEGYGLTETTAAVTGNVPGAVRIGTVGRPLPGVTVRIADDGEVLVRGDMVFSGYWRDEEATAAAFDGGWFRTGDIGALDEDGYLTITGRRKELIVTAGGKNVAPAPLEDRVRAHPLISQCMVVGDRQPYVAALVTIDPDFFSFWKHQHGQPPEATVADLIAEAELSAAVQEAIDAANEAVSRAEAIRRFRILPEDFTEQGGQLTPTLKVKRNVVVKEYAPQIDALYDRAASAGSRFS